MAGREIRKEGKSVTEKTERSPLDSKIAGDLGIPEEKLSLEVLEEYQLKELRSLIAYLKGSPYYREKLEGIDPASIRTLEDFRKLPFTSEADLAGHENEFLCISPGEVGRMVTVPTTGTTGGRKRLAFTYSDIRRAMDFITVAYTTFMHAGDRMMVMMSGGTPGSIGDVVVHSMEQFGAKAYVYGPITDLAEAYQAVVKEKPDVITGIPVQMAALARYSELHGGLQIREALLSADDVPEAIKRRLKRVWGARSFRHYGMTELCIFGGCECCADQGYHVRHSDHYFEIVDPDENGYGEVAVTTFHHEAMPLLRYRTGDYGKLDRTVCGCGSPLPRLTGLRGRLKNSIDLGGGKLFLAGLEELLFSEDAVIDFTCAVHGRTLSLNLKHLAGDEVRTEKVYRMLKELRELENVQISISTEETDGFEPVYNSKKRIQFV